MSKKLFVGSLSWNTTDDLLREAFARFGEILDVKVITDRDSGRSRGFGFVTFDAPGDADTAMNELNGTELDGRRINVSEAQEKSPRGDRAGGPQGGRGGYGGRGGSRDRF